MPDGGPFRCAYEGEGLLCQESESTVCDFITSSGYVQAFSHLSIYPNPVKDELHIDGDTPSTYDGYYSLYTVTGTPVVMNRPLQNQNISLSGLSSGMYFLSWWILMGTS